MITREDVVYIARPGRELKLDVFAAQGERDQRTAVLLLHGGGWRGGSPKRMAAQAESLQSHGFCCLAVEYRLLPEAPWPAQIHDVKAAIRWTRAHAADLGIEPDRIAV